MMCKKRHAMLLLAMVCQLCLLCFALADETAWVRVVPEETDEILANPGMGWETFHRTANKDKNLPSWIPSTVHYARWGWRELEPEQGKIAYDFLDGVLKETREAGQKLAFRVMCCSTTRGEPYHPAWLKELGGRELQSDMGWWKVYPIPDMDDPIILDAHLDFIKRLGQRYDGHPDIDHVDLGSVGWWGEWHLSDSKNCKLPMLENRQKIVQAYLAAFQKTPLLMLVNGEEFLTYATQHGTGWRADCLGDLGFLSKWSHMEQGYPTWISEAGIQETWQTAPVAWETGGDMRHWVVVGSSLRHILNYALALHGSYINNKSAPLPEGENIRPEVERFLRRLGYRLVLKELKHPSNSQPGTTIQLAMKWQNMGSAPCYKPYRVAYRLANDQGVEKVFVGSVTVNKWLPGSIELFTEEFFKEPADLPPGEVIDVADFIQLPNDLSPGTYTLSIAVVCTEVTTPIVRLGIKGRAEDGWYPLSTLTISR
jgi:hypothetical protein